MRRRMIPTRAMTINDHFLNARQRAYQALDDYLQGKVALSYVAWCLEALDIRDLRYLILEWLERCKNRQEADHENTD